MPTLRATLASLAQAFADSVFAAIRGASLEELLEDTTGGAARRRPGRLPTLASLPGLPLPARSGRPTPAKSGRLKRRSPEEIAKALDGVVLLVKSSREGLRSEQIREALGMDRKEMPRVLKEGLAKRRLRAKGNKRATVYTATA
jgi:hypothetical protein